MIELEEWESQNFPKLEYGTLLKGLVSTWICINSNPPIIERSVHIISNFVDSFVFRNNHWETFDDDLINEE